MRTATRTIEIPEQVIPSSTATETVYECDVPGCSFQTEDQEEAEKHHGLQHTAKGQAAVGSSTYYRFESKADAEAWLDAHAPELGDRASGWTWTGPGWYTTEITNEPCGRGCCSVWAVRLISAPTVQRTREQTLHTLIQEIRGLRALRKD